MTFRLRREMWRAPSSRPPSRDLLVPFSHRDKSRCYKIGCTYGTLGLDAFLAIGNVILLFGSRLLEKSASRMTDLVTAGFIPRGKTLQASQSAVGTVINIPSSDDFPFEERDVACPVIPAPEPGSPGTF